MQRLGSRLRLFPLFVLAVITRVTIRAGAARVLFISDNSILTRPAINTKSVLTNRNAILAKTRRGVFAHVTGIRRRLTTTPLTGPAIARVRPLPTVRVGETDAFRPVKTRVLVVAARFDAVFAHESRVFGGAFAMLEIDVRGVKERQVERAVVSVVGHAHDASSGVFARELFVGGARFVVPWGFLGRR